jgi:hypothetical protein
LTRDPVIEAAFDEILIRWHQWQSDIVTKGWAPKSLVCGDFRISRQYDDSNGALDAEIDHQQMKVVDFQVREMVDPYRAAIYVLAKSLTFGITIFASPRLPENKEDRDALIVQAREMATNRFRVAGLL